MATNDPTADGALLTARHMHTETKKTKTFSGRFVTRQILYGDDDTYNPDSVSFLDRPPKAVEPGDWVDPLAEARYQEVVEQPEARVQFERDVRSERFVSLVKSRAVRSTRPEVQAEPDVLDRPLHKADLGQTRYSLDPFVNCKHTVRRAFECFAVVEKVMERLQPELFVSEADRAHITYRRAIEQVQECGGEFVRADREIQRERIRVRIPIDSRDEYKRRMQAEPDAFVKHEHHNDETDETTVVVHEFRCRDDAYKQPASSKQGDGARFRVVTARVEVDSDDDDEEKTATAAFRLFVVYVHVSGSGDEELLCLRAFTFGQ